MERGGERKRSGEPQEVMIKKRNSSGCLIVKKNNCVGSNLEPWMDSNRSRMIMNDSDEHSMRYYRNVDDENRFGLRRDCVDDGKRNTLDDDDDEDELSAMRMRRSVDDGNGVDIGNKAYLGSAQFGIDREYGTSSSSKDLGIEKRRNPYFDALLLRKKYKRDVNFDGPIRVQGKNGVLKVMLNKQNKMGGLLPKNQETGKIRVAVQSSTTVKSKAKLLPPVRIQSNGLKTATDLTMKSEGQEKDCEDSDSLERLQKRIIRPHTGGEKILPETTDRKIRRGSGTEKQRLRERIREMLLEAGWTIDYRPRRNRDYLDAVYISPKGTTYWSIIKAYEALLKQLNSGEQVSKPCEDSSAITIISDEILSQLTRKTKRKIEQDMKREEQYVSDSDG